MVRKTSDRKPSRFPSRALSGAFAVFLFLVILLGSFLFFRPSDDAARLEARSVLLSAMGVPVQEKTADPLGIRTAYLEAGRGDVVVLLHGAGEGGVTWYPVVADLSKNYRLVIPDLPGYGESDKPDASYDPEFFTAWLDAFLKEKNLSRVHLVGSSQGGAVAMRFALKHPDKVDRLVLVGSAGLVKMPDSAFWPFALSNLFPDPFFANGASKDLFVLPGRVNPAWHRYGVEVLRMPGGKNPFLQGRGRMVEPLDDANLSRLFVPTLLLWGEKDAFFPVADVRPRLSLLPASRLVVLPDAGHLPFLENPDGFADETGRFLRG